MVHSEISLFIFYRAALCFSLVYNYYIYMTKNANVVKFRFDLWKNRYYWWKAHIDFPQIATELRVA